MSGRVKRRLGGGVGVSVGWVVSAGKPGTGRVEPGASGMERVDIPGQPGCNPWQERWNPCPLSRQKQQSSYHLQPNLQRISIDMSKYSKFVPGCEVKLGVRACAQEICGGLLALRHRLLDTR